MRTLAFNTFGGGMTSDPRNSATDVSRLCSHFDAFTYPHKLVPYRSYENGDTSASTNQIIRYLYTNGGLYGLAVVSGTSKAQVFLKTDFTATSWLTPANNQSSGGAGGARDTNVFVYYDFTNKIYGLRAGTTVWAFDVAGGVWNDTVVGINYTNTAPALVHSKDDRLYIPTDNIITSFDGSTWTTALTLPSNLVITSICEYGNYLAIGCRSKDVGTHSRVFLWDRNSSLTTLSETIDWGEGTLEVLEELEGYLIGISLTGSSLLSFNNRLVFRYYSSTLGAVKFNELVASANTGVLSQSKQRVNNRLYFMASLTLQGIVQQGVWAIGRPTSGAPFAVILDHLLDNTQLSTDAISPGSFILIGDYFHITYQDNGNYAMSKTDHVANYVCTSIFETTINPEQPEMMRGSAGSRSNNKQLVAAALGYVPLQTGQQAVLKYKIDGGSFIIVGTFTNAIPGESVVAERTFDAAGNQPTSGREYEFHIESTGGAEITELKYKIEVLETLL